MPVTLERFPINPTASAAHAQLVVLFPDSDPGFIEQCISHWLALPPPASASTGSSTTYRRATSWTTQALVERVTNKLLEIRPEGEWPRAAPPVRGRASGDVQSIASSSQVRRAFGRTATGRGEAGSSSAASRRRVSEGRREDVALARNLALTRLHAMFPLVPVVDLRDLVLAQPHSALFECADVLARRSNMPLKRDPSTALGADLLEAAAAAFSRLFGAVDPHAHSRPRSSRTKKGKERARPSIEHSDPVLTPADLFHSPAHDAALVAHFGALFPALAPLSSAPIERVVRREGGSYASMRERLERAAADAEDERDRPWWSRWIGGPSSSAREASTTATGGSSGRRRGLGRTSTRETIEAHPLIRREVEAFERAQRGPPSAPVHTPHVETAPALDSVPLVECQCCFAAVLFSPTQLACCSDIDAPADLPSSPPSPSALPHLFCRDCVLAYARTFTFGGAASLPSVALERSALPCISAAGSAPCGRVFRHAELVKALDAPTLAALSSQITSATLERLALPSSSSGAAAGVRLLRCPFCQYAELADPVPGTLARTFLPAWVAEPFPPYPSQILHTLLGALALLFLLLLAALLALVSPARRLERAYAALHPPDVSAAQEQQQPSLLTLPERLLLAPHHLPALSVAYVRRVVERVLRDKEGDVRRVFRCRNDGAALGPGDGRRGQAWLARLQAVQELEWGDEQEGVSYEEGEVEERRRAALVRFLWGPSALDDAVQGGARAPDEPSVCGKLSCLLCSAAVNPSAPSLHACRASSSSSSDAAASGAEPASEQEQAEESLRLAVERAMSDAVKRDCGRCGAALQKETGNGACNKVVCRCGFIYCHACRREIPSWQGYGHFCPHPRDPTRVRREGDKACDECDKCSLWDEPDEVERVKEAVERARVVWAAEHPAWAKKVDLEAPVAFQPDAQEVPVYEWLADGYDALVEGVVRSLVA
ncbi:hypothetical protein JCM3775_005445 [Rhodotorula graminis]